MKEIVIDEFNAKIKSITDTPCKLIPRFGHHFPDLDLHIGDKTYGIELKSRNNGSWITLGGSVIESISKDNYEEIYLLFASFNKKKGETSYKVRYQPYWQAADAIKVTHSPRFDLNLDSDKSVFSSNDDYKALRDMKDDDKLSFIRKILAENATGATWYTQPNETVPPTLYTSLQKEQKEKLKTEVLVLFPQDLLHQPRARYDRITDYLLSQYFVVNTSTRDMFTAGGTIELKGVKFPRIIDSYRKHRNQIENLLKTGNSDFIDLAYSSWNIADNQRNDIRKDFITIINNCGIKYMLQNLESIHTDKLSDLLF